MIEQVIISTSADTSQAENQYVGLRKEIKNLKAQLDLLEEGTVEYNKVFTQLSIKMQDQKERMTALRNSGADLGVMLGNVSKISGAISQGFAGATAALSLFGIENENLLRTIQKVQAFESIARTLESFEDAPKRIKALFQNISGLISKKDMKIEIEADIKTPNVNLDVEGSKEMAESSKQMENSSKLAAGSAAATAGYSQQTAASTGTTAKLQQEILDKKLASLVVEGSSLSTSAEQLQLDANRLKVGFEKITLSEQENTIQLQILNEKLRTNQLTQEEYEKEVSILSIKNQQLNKEREILLQEQQSLLKKAEAGGQRAGEIYEEADEIKKTIELNNEQTNAVEKTTKATNGLKGVFSSLGSVLKGVGIGIVITAAIAGITKLIDLYKKQQEKIKEAFQFRKDLSEEVGKSLSKEQSTLSVLNFNYNKYKDNQKESNKYLLQNKKAYADVGIEVDKIIKGEITYSEAIKQSNELLKQRAENMAYFSQLTKAFEKKITAETIVGQYAEDIMSGVVKYDDISKDLIAQYDVIAKADKEIDFLRRKITSLPKDSGEKGGTTQTSNLKTYTELMGELIEKQQSVKLNNPFNPEEVRKNELFFEEQKKSIDNLILELLKTPGYNSTVIENLRNYRIQLLEIERDYNLRSRDLKIKDAEWNRDNNIREREEQLKKDKEYYENVLKAAKESLKKGVITESEFKQIEDKVKAGSDLSIIEFTKNLQEKLKVGKITYDEFKKQLNTFAGTDLTVKSPTGEINTGNLTVENYNFIQDLLSQWDDYYKNLQEYQLNYKNQSKKTDEDIFNEKMTAIDRLTTESTRQTEMSNARIITEMNNRNSKSWLTGFQGYRSGYKDFLDEIKMLQNDLDLNKGLQDKSTERIDTIKKELENENITNEKRIELKEQLATEEQNLTNLIQTESEKRIEIAEKEQAVIDETISGTLQGIQDIGTIINGVYDIREQTELKRLNDLYKAKLITEEEYNKQSEEVGLKYSKKRQELEIFTGTMAAVGSSIGAFQSAVNSGIPYPYNLILAGISSAAAFASVLASVAQLKSMSIDNTSNVNPVSSQTGSSLNYSLNEQTSTQERLMNKLKDQKVYILATEMTDTQDLLAKIEDMNTF